MRANCATVRDVCAWRKGSGSGLGILVEERGGSDCALVGKGHSSFGTDV